MKYFFSMVNQNLSEATDEAEPQQHHRDAAVERLRQELKRRVRASDQTQRAIEDANGFSHGYLSQVLQGHVTLTARHVFGILFALDIPPENFFWRLFRGSRRDEPLSEIRERMDRYDAAIKQLEDKGVLTIDSKSEGKL